MRVDPGTVGIIKKGHRLLIAKSIFLVINVDEIEDGYGIVLITMTDYCSNDKIIPTGHTISGQLFNVHGSTIFTDNKGTVIEDICNYGFMKWTPVDTIDQLQSGKIIRYHYSNHENGRVNDCYTYLVRKLDTNNHCIFKTIGSFGKQLLHFIDDNGVNICIGGIDGAIRIVTTNLHIT